MCQAMSWVMREQITTNPQTAPSVGSSAQLINKETDVKESQFLSSIPLLLPKRVKLEALLSRPLMLEPIDPQCPCWDQSPAA